MTVWRVGVVIALVWLGSMMMILFVELEALRNRVAHLHKDHVKHVLQRCP